MSEQPVEQPKVDVEDVELDENAGTGEYIEGPQEEDE